MIVPSKQWALSCGEEQDNFVWPIEVPLIGRFCLPKSRCSVETVRKCQLVYYAYNYKKVDERGFKRRLKLKKYLVSCSTMIQIHSFDYKSERKELEERTRKANVKTSHSKALVSDMELTLLQVLV
ncbi:hypothetical protein MTR67_004082 [Solanum verrucosum]|uniref:Uncharacterized protein n=1 Tax=Solanum verrucosum TaxID=315347 RepID=A0AAF0PTX5_SOLVR|nr:hypothetical protein MTR67_004082 [Solanum verrucosum]